MAVKVELSYAEHPKAIDKKGNYTSIEVQYLVFGVTTEEEALTAVHGKAPAESKGLPLDSIEIDTRETNDTFRVNAIYREEEVEVGDSGGDDDDETPTESFDCGGGPSICSTVSAREKSTATRTPEEPSAGTGSPATTAKSPGWTSPPPNSGRPTPSR